MRHTPTSMSTDEANAYALKQMSESLWQESVVAHARAHGWIAHFIPDAFHADAKRSGRMRVTKQGDKGFPDLTLASDDGQVVYAELKTEVGLLKPEQIVWRNRLVAAGQEWHLWRPRHLDEIIARFKQRASPAPGTRRKAAAGKSSSATAATTASKRATKSSKATGETAKTPSTRSSRRSST